MISNLQGTPVLHDGINDRMARAARRAFARWRRWCGIQTWSCGFLLPVVLGHISLGERARLRRLDIAALVTLLVCNICVLGFMRMKRKREEKSLPWVTWKDGAPAPSNDYTNANRTILHWGVFAVAGLMGASYSWVTNHWIILPIFLAGGYWVGWRARKLLRH